MNPKPVRDHALLLVLCSAISFVGHYLQFGIARATPWIPASVGFCLLVLLRHRQSWAQSKWVILAIVVLFGLLTTRMGGKFWFQSFQPLRKKLVFTAMSVSALVCLARVWRYHPEPEKDGTPS